jgi:hypothetical protein
MLTSAGWSEKEAGSLFEQSCSGMALAIPTLAPMRSIHIRMSEYMIVLGKAIRSPPNLPNRCKPGQIILAYPRTFSPKFAQYRLKEWYLRENSHIANDLIIQL